jgi:hypothetical protein
MQVVEFTPPYFEKGNNHNLINNKNSTLKLKIKKLATSNQSGVRSMKSLSMLSSNSELSSVNIQEAS